MQEKNSQAKSGGKVAVEIARVPRLLTSLIEFVRQGNTSVDPTAQLKGDPRVRSRLTWLPMIFTPLESFGESVSPPQNMSSRPTQNVDRGGSSSGLGEDDCFSLSHRLAVILEREIFRHE